MTMTISLSADPLVMNRE